jgi:hypothetical protein
MLLNLCQLLCACTVFQADEMDRKAASVAAKKEKQQRREEEEQK